MLTSFIFYSTKAIEISSVFVIVGGAVLASIHYIQNMKLGAEDAYGRFRRHLGRSILLGLELLVAADIIATVSLEPSLDDVIVLGLVVFIRTFLSFSLEIELEGRLPWKTKLPDNSGAEKPKL